MLWNGDFESGGVPHGANGLSCGTGVGDGPDSAADQYHSVEEMGNSACTSKVSLAGGLTRTPDSKRALRITMGTRQQRELMASKYSWTPDAKGTVDQWYGFSIYYESDWNLVGGLLKEVSGSAWHSPIGWRMSGGNGSMNFSGDMNLNNGDGRPYQSFATPHMVLRRNTVMFNQGFYKDGAGLDKMDLGPIVTNKWMDFVCHVRWSTTATNALRECWRDGTYMGAKTTVNTVAAMPHELRVGQYQDTVFTHDRTSVFDNVRIGTSYDAVDPSRG